jgi:hypothetical protein
MVQSYPVLLFCVAALVDMALSRKVLLWLLAPVALVFIYFNIWITYIYHKGDLFDNDCMSRAYFWRIAGRFSAPPGIAVLKENPDLFEGEPHNARTIYQNDFEKETGPFFTTIAGTTGQILTLGKDNQNSPVFRFPFAPPHPSWLRAQASFHCAAKEYEGWKMAQFVVRLMHKDSIVKERMIRVYRILADQQTKTISLDMKLPAADYDSVNVLFWNGSSDKQLWIDDLKVTVFD